MKCECSLKCRAEATCAWVWPGKWARQLACDSCTRNAVRIADVMGFDLRPTIVSVEVVRAEESVQMLAGEAACVTCGGTSDVQPHGVVGFQDGCCPACGGSGKAASKEDVA